MLGRYLAILTALIAAALFAVAEANATVIIPINNNPDVAVGDKTIKITEHGASGSLVAIQLTGKAPGVPDGPVGSLQKATIDKSGAVTFTFKNKYIRNGINYTIDDYTQQLGDPAILSAGAFQNGSLVPLADWLIANGYTDENDQIIQPDFFSTDGSPLYAAVDLTQLGDAGAAFAAAQSFGDILTVGTNDMVSGLPGELLSSTLPVEDPGSGWVVTPLASGTDVEYGGFHSTYAVPEPASIVLLGSALLGFGAIRRRRRG